MVRCFPDSEVFQINYYPGSAGKFISTLCYHLKYPNSSCTPKVSSKGNSHTSALVCQNTWETASTKKYYSRKKYFNNFFKQLPIYEVVNPNKEFKTLILSDHTIPIIDNMVLIYPKIKNITITIRDSDYLWVTSNQFYKWLIDSYVDESAHLHWQCLKKNYPNLFYRFETPDELDQITIEKYLNTKVNNNTDADFLREYYTETNPSLFDNKNIIFTIKFMDIMHNPNLVLDALSNILESPITDKVIGFYQNYLGSQRLLIENYMPWIKQYYYSFPEDLKN